MWTAIQTGAVSFGFALLLALVTWLASPRVRITWGTPHSFFHRVRLQEQEVGISTASIFVSNSGRKMATNVEVVFNWPVETISIWPQRYYQCLTNPEGRFAIQFKDLAPREFVQIHILAIGQLPSVLTVRSSEATGKQIKIVPMRLYPTWFNVSALLLILVGVWAIIFLVFTGLAAYF
jgi:hypothetical protein